MKLVIFDVDGTLTRTVEVDSACFVQAFADEFKITDINTDWARYEHYTDSGIADEIFRQKLGRALSPEEHIKLIDRFLFLLGKNAKTSPELFGEIPGAKKTLLRLENEPGWKMAIATGCWLDSAFFKLEKAGIRPQGIPIASADDSMIREKIARLSRKRARSLYRVRHFQRVVYVGDGIWDVRMARRLEIPFLGVGDEEKQKYLSRAGAEHFLPDLRDYDLFLRKLDEADVPGPV